MTAGSARLPPPGLPGLKPEWSRLVDVTDRAGVTHTWHVLDTAGGHEAGDRAEPTGTLLCVHGNPTWSYLWRGLVADPPPGWRVVAPDQLGMGWSDRIGSPRDVAQRVADLGDLTDALGVTRPVVTVGHDWGGAISLGWALCHRRQLRGVVLTNTAVALAEADRGPALIRLAHLPWLRAGACVRTPTFVRATTALSWPPLPATVRRAFAAPYRSAARRRAVGDFVADIPFARDHPSATTVDAIAEGVRSLDVPALLLWGPRDPVFGERYLADLRDRLPQAQLHRYEGASHLVTEDAPRYAAAVREWVADLDGPLDLPSTQGARPGSMPDRSLGSALAARAHDLSPAVVEADGLTITWAELADRVDRLAAGLASAGVRPGDRVALLVPPSAELTTFVYAIWRAGAVIVVADQGLGLRGMRRALRSASVDHVVGETAGLLAARVMGVPGSRVAASTVGRILARRLGADHGVRDLVRLGASAPMPEFPTPDQDCAVLFTSGATGPAKGVAYRHGQAAAQLDLLRTAYRITDGDRLVAAFAPFALLGPGLGIASAVPDIDVTAPQTLTAPLLADAVAAVGATVVFAAPAALRGVVASANGLSSQQRSALAGVRLLVSAGAPVPAALLRSLADVLPGAEAHTPYGMTEALPVTDISLAQIEAAGPGNGVCVGRPLEGVDVAVRPFDGGELTSESWVSGEICVRGPHVKDRYDALWATQRASALDPGWHRTSDVGHRDGEGRLWVEGRLAHVVTTAAGPVTPVGIEQRVEALPEVAAAAVVGVGPPGAQVVAIVVVPTHTRRSWRRTGSRSGALADPTLTDAVRDAAGASVAAVFVRPSLPVDIRHASKVDRLELARWAVTVLAGS